MFSIVMYTLSIVLLLLSLKKDINKTKMVLKKSWKAFENILPQFISIIILIGILLVLLDKQAISNLIGGDSGFIGIIISALIGSITLIPGFIAFPLAKILLVNGAGLSQIAAFVSALMMVGIVTIPLEIKYWGKKATFIRNILAFLFSIIIAITMGVIL